MGNKSNRLKALLIMCVTAVLLSLINGSEIGWSVVIAVIIVLTVLILATVNHVSKLPEILSAILNGLRNFK